jgi:protoporphyrinogen oxidase
MNTTDPPEASRHMIPSGPGPSFIILGGGPCGLGAAWRLCELNGARWRLFEKESYWGGLATSFIDANGYTWDVGGHVLFSHYDYFDSVLESILPLEANWFVHDRESWIRVQGKWAPYPFQLNIRHLAPEVFLSCIRGIIDLYRRLGRVAPLNFEEWMYANFGVELAELFMRPYNEKVWGFPLNKMSWTWVGDRIAPIDLERIIENYVLGRDDVAWGPNNRFRFPLSGGTGSIWRSLVARLPQNNLSLREGASKIDLDKRTVCTAPGQLHSYDVLISTLNLAQLCQLSKVEHRFPGLQSLKTSSTHVVGLGVRGVAPEELRTKCWMYFPEDNCPFYRVTHFSHYSPNNVPDINRGWSLMAEVSETENKPVDRGHVVNDVIDGLVRTGLIADSSAVMAVWHGFFQDTYPIPTIDRDEVVGPILEFFEERGVFSRGRIGAWKYEVGNMDHSFMQGKECVDRILLGTEEVTLNHPAVVNSPRDSRSETPTWISSNASHMRDCDI